MRRSCWKFVLGAMGVDISMSEPLTPEKVEELKAKRREEVQELEEEAREWRMELYKMGASLAINVFVILVLVFGALITTADISSRFMSLLEIVIGAIFGVTATQIAKE